MPGVEIVVVGDREVDVGLRVPGRHDAARVGGGSGQPEVARAISVDEERAMLEPRLGHDDGLHHIDHLVPLQLEECTDGLGARPVFQDAENRDGPHGLRDDVPVCCRHLRPARVGMHDGTAAGEQGTQRRRTVVCGQLVPVLEVHAGPQGMVAHPEVPGSDHRELLPGGCVGHVYRRRVEPAVQERRGRIRAQHQPLLDRTSTHPGVVPRPGRCGQPREEGACDETGQQVSLHGGHATNDVRMASRYCRQSYMAMS